MSKKVVKGNVLFNTVLVSLEVEKQKGSILLVNSTKSNTNNEGKLLDVQEVMAVGDQCQNVKVGDKVLVDFGAFMKEVRVAGNNAVGDGGTGTEWQLQLPLIDIGGVQYGHISERNIKYVYHPSELKAKEEIKEIKA